MKRLHVHVAVDDVPSSVRFYSTLFAAEPTVLESDYAKWMLEDPPPKPDLPADAPCCGAAGA